MSVDPMERLLEAHARLLSLLASEELPGDTSLVEAWAQCDQAFAEVERSPHLSAEALQRARHLNGLLVERIGELCRSLESELVSTRQARNFLAGFGAGSDREGHNLDLRG